jgi:hypothetical protein
MVYGSSDASLEVAFSTRRQRMAKYKDKIDLYDDRGKVIEKGVPLEAISPLVTRHHANW